MKIEEEKNKIEIYENIKKKTQAQIDRATAVATHSKVRDKALIEIERTFGLESFDLKPASYCSRLDAYMNGFVKRTERYNTDYNNSRECIKDRIMKIISDHKKPIAQYDIECELCDTYPEYQELSRKGIDKYIQELESEYRLIHEFGIKKEKDFWGNYKDTDEPF